MPLGNLGACSTDLIAADRAIKQYSKDYCSIINSRFKPKGLPPRIEPPPNSVRWEPGKDKPLAFPAPPETATDILVFEERVPLGYDGIIMSLPRQWSGTGFVEGSGDITWRVKLDQRYIPYYDTILTSLSLNAPLDVMGQGIDLRSGQLLQYFVNFAVGSDARLNNDGLTICAAIGYIWPRERQQV